MPRVLVIDDDVHQTRVLEARLQAAGLEVLAVNDAHTATEIVFGFRPNVILLDINMPSYSGLEFHDCLQRVDRGKDIPVVYLTGHDNWVHREQARRQNAFAFLPKPYEASVLLETIRDALKSAGSHVRMPEETAT